MQFKISFTLFLSIAALATADTISTDAYSIAKARKNIKKNKTSLLSANKVLALAVPVSGTAMGVGAHYAGKRLINGMSRRQRVDRRRKPTDGRDYLQNPSTGYYSKGNTRSTSSKNCRV